MNRSGGMVKILYTTVPGRIILKIIQKSHADRLIVRFLKSKWSVPYLDWYIKHYRVNISDTEEPYRSFRDFFARKYDRIGADITPEHLISPCDGWLSAYPVTKESVFCIKGSHYQVSDFLQDEALAKNYEGGTCLVFRLSPTDCHHYLYIDDGYQGRNHYIPGKLHSVQPIACSIYPVYTQNRRNWCLMATEHFGPVVQTEIGALIVGGIVNYRENTRFCKGTEKGRFELAGSTIVLLFEPCRIRLLPELEREISRDEEIRVRMGQQIGNGKQAYSA